MKHVDTKTNFIYNAVFQLSNIIIPIITTPYLTRTLHAQGMGEYAFAYSVSYYFYMFIRLGLHNYGNRTIAFSKDNKAILSKTFCNIYAFQLFMGCLMSLFYFIYCMIISNNIIAFIFSLMVMAGGLDITWALYGLEEFKVTALRDIAIKIITAISIFIFVKDSEDVWKYALIYCLGFMISQIVSFPIVLKRIDIVRPDMDGIREHIKPNLILFLPTIAVSIYKTMDKIMLGFMAESNELGFYHSSENIIMVPMAFITALGTVMLPRMSNLFSNNERKEDIERVFDKSMLFAMFVSTSVCCGIMTVSKEFVPIFFGKGFEKCISLFYIILPSCIFLAFANVIRTQFLLPRKRDKLYVASLFSGAVTNLLFNLLLIPKYASIGAAIGTLAAEIVVCVIQAAFVFEEANIGRNIINALPFVISGTLMFLFFRNLRIDGINIVLGLFIKIVICGAFYLMIMGVILWGKNAIFRKTKNI